jgi:exopolysaccharide biosynthesis protein
MPIHTLKFPLHRHKKLIIIGSLYVFLIFALSLGMVATHKVSEIQQFTHTLQAQNADVTQTLSLTQEQLASVSASLEVALSEDQYVKNKFLEATISAIQKTYQQSIVVYEDLLELKTKTSNTAALDKLYAQTVSQLIKRDYVAAESTIQQLSQGIAQQEAKLATTFSIPANVPVNNSPPGSGYSRQQVQIDLGSYMVSIVSADLNSTKVIVDTASDATCTNDCPVMNLGDYVSRSGAFAGVNGPYFCPATYPSCAGKTNSFDTLIMNKNKVYFNSDNNVYSNVPAVIFSGSSARYVGATSQWGRDTGVDSVIAAQPMLLSGGNVVFGGDGDPKKGSKSNRAFIGTNGSTVYIGVVHNATVAEVAHVLKGLGLQNALNLDAGGSTALWSGGYKAGPGRALPFGILLVRK